jgi:hypothetical protein
MEMKHGSMGFSCICTYGAAIKLSHPNPQKKKNSEKNEKS